MAIDFKAMGESLVKALLEPDAEKRAAAVSAWWGSTSPALEEAAENKLSEYVLLLVQRTMGEPNAANHRACEDDGGDGKAGRSPNDDRSDVMNPNNSASNAAADNRSDQMNPNNPAYHSSRGR